jgi:hypothetical protein
LKARNVLLAAACAVVACAAAPAPAKPPARGPSTPEERAKAVTLVKSIEAQPLGPEADDARRWLVKWINEVPDIDVHVCGDLVAPALLKSYPYSKQVGYHAIFAQTGFAIEHPDKAKDRLAGWTAGTEGTLRVYEAILKTKPDARLAYLDDLVARRDRGELRAFVEQSSKKCK